MKIYRLLTIFTYLLAFISVSSPAQAKTPTDAKQILDATGIKGGLVVNISCGDGDLTAALRSNDSYLVNGLDKNVKNIEPARRHIKSLGIYGKVSIAHLG